jgi:RNA polymerase sigma-70 factor (ECF subfamily)
MISTRSASPPAIPDSTGASVDAGTTDRTGATRSRDSALAAEVKALILAGQRERARQRFADLVTRQQRRAVRIAFNYLRDADDADEAVQDAFVKVFTHITSYREDLPFEVWFTRILVNRCLDMRKARARRLRWALPMTASLDAPSRQEPVATTPSPEARLMSSERAREIAAAVSQLPLRQRTVFALCHMAELSAGDVGRALDLSEATVRVHLFRAVRKLRALLAPTAPPLGPAADAPGESAP